MADVIRGQAVTVQVTHDGIDTDRYDLVINGAIAASKPPDDKGVSFPIEGGLAPGTYVFAVDAVGPGGTTRSNEATLVVVPRPPSSPSISIVIGV